SADGHLAGRRGGPAPRQPGLGAGHPGRAAQPDDGRGGSDPLRGRDRPRPLPRRPLVLPQPEGPPNGPAAFEPHATLPQVELDTAVATVLVGSFAGAASPARRDTELVGAGAAVGRGTGA